MFRISDFAARAAKHLPAVAAGLVTIALPTLSSGQALPRLTEPVNESQMVTLKGSTHPWAQPQFDRGPVEDSHAGRMLLVLKRSVEQDKALRQLVDDQQNAGSPSFHKWLTPDEFGKRFGVADADMQTVTGYLQSKGFTVGRIYKNKGAIEVSGTAGQLRETFHTQMHMYSIGGKEFFANANDPKIPAALAPVVRGFASLNNIQATSLATSSVGSEARTSVPVTFDAKTHSVKAQYTYAQNGTNYYLLAPKDVQTIYNVPVSSTTLGNGGMGVTVGVIGDSQINLNLVSQYQALGGSGVNTPVEIVDGSEPVIVPATTGPDATIAYEQLELISAVAPNANLNYYVSSTTDFDTGLDFAIIRAVEDDAVSVLAMGFQTCEKNLTAVGNQLVEASWLQAAAQGMTVVAAAGDTGSGGCDIPGSTASSTGGLAVNGYASTPYNTAVGGTDFYYTPLGAATYWNASTANGSYYSSAKSYIPEQAWNDSLQTNDSVTGTSILNAGGGGFSTLGNVAADGVTQSPYPVPSWQTSAQAQSARAVPDVSFFAGNGYNSAWYVICAATVDCSFTNTTATITGGTAGSAAVFAGIMAEVVAKYGPQGNANPALYGMLPTNATTNVFHDTIVGNNTLACSSGTGCTGGYLKSGVNYAYTAGANYDEATGLGSVNATNLITNWKVPATATSATSLVIKNDSTLAPITASVVHGTPLRLVATVTGSGTPTGNVAFTTGNTSQAGNGLIAETLVSGVATSSYDLLLPGGSYNVTARYAGDATNLPSVGTYPITVTPEPTRILMVSSTYPTGSTVTYGQTVKLTVEPFSLNNNTVAAPTGTVGLYNGTNDPITVLPLSSEGTASFATNLLGGGQTYSLVFGYSGDASFQNSTSQTPYIIKVTQAATTTMLYASSTASPNTPVTLSAVVSPPATLTTGVAPTGTVSFYTVGGPVIANLVSGYSTTGQAVGIATIQVSPAQIPSAGSVTGTYSSDVNYATSSYNQPISTVATGANTTGLTLSLNSSTVATDGTLTVTTKATASSGTPSGLVKIFANAVQIGSYNLTVGNTTSYTIPLTGGYLPIPSGAVTITALFTNVLNYSPSSATALLTVTDDRTVGDFSVSTDVQTQTLTSSSNILYYKIQLTAVQNFAGLNDPITLSCAVPSNSNLNCSIGNSFITIGSTGSYITTLTITGKPTGGTGALHAPVEPQHWWLVGGGSALACVFFLGIPARRKGLQGFMAALVCVVLLTGSITGCGSRMSTAANVVDSGSTTKEGGIGGGATANYTKGLASNTVPAGNYQVVITASATSNTLMVHNTSVTVAVNAGQLIPNGSYTLDNFYSNMVLDANGSTASGAGIVQNTPVAGNKSQKWSFISYWFRDRNQ